jgi:hypothetical protein
MWWLESEHGPTLDNRTWTQHCVKKKLIWYYYFCQKVEKNIIKIKLSLHSKKVWFSFPSFILTLVLFGDSLVSSHQEPFIKKSHFKPSFTLFVMTNLSYIHCVSSLINHNSQPSSLQDSAPPWHYYLIGFYYSFHL